MICKGGGGCRAITLTTGIDDKIVGTAAAETINGVVSAAIAEGTLQGTDTIDGGDGADTLKLDMQKSFDGFTTGSMKNVETVNLTNKSVGAIDFVAKGVTGATSYVVDSTKGAINLKSLSELASIDLKGPADNSTFTAEYTATSTVATGTQTDTQVLKVSNVGTINTAAAGQASNAKVMTVNIAKVEALELTTAGTANTLNLAGVTDAKTYKISGEGQTEVQAVSAATTSFDASGSNGNVIANLTAAGDAKLATVKGGAGSDVLTVALSDLTTTATIEGGAGVDRLDVASSSGSKTLQATMSGVEAVRFTTPGQTGAVTFSGTNVSDLAKAEFQAGGLLGSVSFVNMKASAFEVALEGAVTGNTIAADNAAAITANVNNTATATTAATATTGLSFGNATGVTVNVNKLMNYAGTVTTGTKGDVTVNVASNVVNGAETTAFAGTLTANTAKSITVNADGGLDVATSGNGVDINAGKATAVTIKAGATAAASVNLVAGEATSLNLTVGSKGLDMDGAGATATNLDKVQTLSATNSGFVDFTGVALKAVSNATVTGSGDKSKATFGTLGDTAQTYNLNLTVTGQKDGLTTGAVKAGTGAATVNISGVTGNTVMTSIEGAAGVTLNANKLAGTFSNGNSVIQATAGSVSIDVGAMEKTAEIARSGATLNNIIAGDAAGAASNTKGDVTLTATNAIGGVTTGVITGDNVSIDATNALAAVVVGNGSTANTDIFAKTSVTYKGATLATLVNAADIQAVNSSTALTVNLSGGAGNETFTVAGSAKQESIVVKGNVGAGTNSVTVTLADNTDATKTQTVDLSGFTGSDKATTVTNTILSAESNAIAYKGSAMNDTISIVSGVTAAYSNTSAVSIIDTTLNDSDKLVLDAGTNAKDVTLTKLSLSGIEELQVNGSGATNNIVSINASAVSAQSIKISGSATSQSLTLTGTEGNDVIDLSNLAAGTNAPTLKVVAGAGNDTIVLSALADQVVFTAATDGVDTITGFKAADDSIVIDGALKAALASDTTKVAGDAGSAAAYAIETDAIGTVLAAANSGTNAVTAANLTDLTKAATLLNAAFTFTDAGSEAAQTEIFAIQASDFATTGNNKFAVYAWAQSSATDTTVDAAELKLLGVVTADAFTAADIVIA